MTHRTTGIAAMVLLLAAAGGNAASATPTRGQAPAAKRSAGTPPAAAQMDRSAAKAALMGAIHFTIGPAGFAGTVSDAEKGMRALLAGAGEGPKAAEAAVGTFRDALRARETTPAGRLYALLGLRLADPPAYRESVARGDYRPRAGETVTTLRGCLAEDRPAADVAAEIARGRYDPAKATPGTPKPAKASVPKGVRQEMP